MPHTILVVDDEPQLVKVLRGYLEQAGFRVVTAGDGPMALAPVNHEKPHLIRAPPTPRPPPPRLAPRAPLGPARGAGLFPACNCSRPRKAMPSKATSAPW